MLAWLPMVGAGAVGGSLVLFVSVLVGAQRTRSVVKRRQTQWNGLDAQPNRSVTPRRAAGGKAQGRVGPKALAPARPVRAKRMPAERLPAERMPAERMPAERMPAERLPAERLPAKNMPMNPMLAETVMLPRVALSASPTPPGQRGSSQRARPPSNAPSAARLPRAGGQPVRPPNGQPRSALWQADTQPQPSVPPPA